MLIVKKVFPYFYNSEIEILKKSDIWQSYIVGHCCSNQCPVCNSRSAFQGITIRVPVVWRSPHNTLYVLSHGKCPLAQLVHEYWQQHRVEYSQRSELVDAVETALSWRRGPWWSDRHTDAHRRTLTHTDTHRHTQLTVPAAHCLEHWVKRWHHHEGISISCP